MYQINSLSLVNLLSLIIKFSFICQGHSYRVCIALKDMNNNYRQFSNMRRTESQTVNVSHLVLQLFCPIYWSHVLSWEWRCSWSSADRRCSIYSWVTNNLMAHVGASNIKYFMVAVYLNTTKHSKAWAVCINLGLHCARRLPLFQLNMDIIFTETMLSWEILAKCIFL